MKKLIVSSEANPMLIKYLKNEGYDVVLFGYLENVPKPISCHPDLVYCALTDDYTFIGDKDKLGEKYPLDIMYNACSTGKYFIHNLKYTDAYLNIKADEAGLIKINVLQGYSKCSIAVVDENSIITYDEGIKAACEKRGLNVLGVSSGHVLLPGYSSGFIGGCTGKIKDTIIFNGDISLHPDYERIREFIEERNLKIKYFTEYQLTDIGSIIAV